MRILFSTQPMYGHVNTVLAQALAARRAGHDVVFATGMSMTRYVEQQGLEVWPVGPDRAPRGPGVDWITFFIESAGQRAETLVPRGRLWAPDLVIHEETELSSPLVVAATGARHVVHGLGLMPPMRLWEVLAAAIDRLAADWNVAFDAERMRRATYLDVCPPALTPPGERIWHHAQPLRHSTGSSGATERLPDEFDRMPYRRFTHLTLGTVFNDPAILQTALAGLRDLATNVVVTTGPGTDPASLGRQPANVVVLPYASHDLLIPRCDLVVSHAGAGVMLGALAHGVPQLALPQGADQHLNAQALVQSGAGLMLDGEDATADSVRATADRLLSEEGFSEAAGVVRAEMRAMPDARAVIAALSEAAGARGTGAALTSL